MPVHISIALSPKPKRGNRGVAYDRHLRGMIPAFVIRQRQGHVGIQALAAELNRAQIWNGLQKPWSYGGLRRALHRARELGAPVIIRSASEAARSRPVSYRARNEAR